jgi:hypothetical protein
VNEKIGTAVRFWSRIAIAAAAIAALALLWSRFDTKTELGLACVTTVLIVVIAAPTPWSWLRPPQAVIYTLIVGAIGASLMLLTAHIAPDFVGLPSGPVPPTTLTPRPSLSTTRTPTAASPSVGAAPARAFFPGCANGQISDPDGDGWGWEDNHTCVVAGSKIETSYAYCSDVAADPDGDGWGWENNQSCIVHNGKSDPAKP